MLESLGREVAEQGWKASARARASPPPQQQQQSAVGGAIRCSFRVVSNAIDSSSGWEQVLLSDHYPRVKVCFAEIGMNFPAASQLTSFGSCMPPFSRMLIFGFGVA
jgi:hypothetical protein